MNDTVYLVFHTIINAETILEGVFSTLDKALKEQERLEKEIDTRNGDFISVEECVVDHYEPLF